MKNRNNVSTLGKTLGFKAIIPLIAIAGLSMGNQSCEATPTARVLKMDIEIGTLKGRSVKLPNGEVIDFPYVANSLFYRQVINHNHFVIGNPVPSSLGLASTGGVFKTQSTKDSSSTKVAPTGMVSPKDVAVLEKFGMLNKTRAEGAQLLSGAKSVEDVMTGKSDVATAAALPACLYDMPQALLGGEIISFEATWGAGLGVGYNAGGDLAANVGGSVQFKSSKLEIGLRTDDPLSHQVIAIGDGVSHQSDVNFGIDFLASLIGLDFFYKTPITDVIRAGMDDGLNQIVDTYKKQLSKTGDWNEVWEGRVIYDPELVNGDTHVAINAGYRAGVQVGDTFNISNMHYSWEGAACYTRLKSKIPLTTTPIATAEVVSVGDNVSVLKVTYLMEQQIQPGAQVKVLKLKAPVVSKAAAAVKTAQR